LSKSGKEEQEAKINKQKKQAQHSNKCGKSFAKGVHYVCAKKSNNCWQKVPR